jgi:hypothetical protein
MQFSNTDRSKHLFQLAALSYALIDYRPIADFWHHVDHYWAKFPNRPSFAPPMCSVFGVSGLYGLLVSMAFLSSTIC